MSRTTANMPAQFSRMAPRDCAPSNGAGVALEPSHIRMSAQPAEDECAAGRVVSGMSGSIRGQSRRGCTVPNPNENPNVQNPAGWAVAQATAELYDVDDPDVIFERARELVREAEQREYERHDEYDDPDQGGEA
jgi:hypothetical protein